MLPICGASLAVMAITAGIFGRRSENRGMALGILGLLIAMAYAVLLAVRSGPNL